MELAGGYTVKRTRATLTDGEMTRCAILVSEALSLEVHRSRDAVRSKFFATSLSTTPNLRSSARGSRNGDQRKVSGHPRLRVA